MFTPYGTDVPCLPIAEPTASCEDNDQSVRLIPKMGSWDYKLRNQSRDCSY